MEKCEYCDNVFKAKEMGRVAMEKYGFYTHYVIDEDAVDYANIHTHGVEESFGHKDFQIVIALRHQTASYLMHDLVDRIKAGTTFKDGDVIDDLICDSEGNGDLRFKIKEVISDNVDDGGRQLLRLLLPDKNGLLPGEEGCNKLYERQITIDLEECKNE